jgi:hypothetical protein
MERMRKAGDEVNWSSIARVAFVNHLDKIEDGPPTAVAINWLQHIETELTALRSCLEQLDNDYLGLDAIALNCMNCDDES